MDRHLPAGAVHGNHGIDLHRRAGIALRGARRRGVTNVTLEVAQREYAKLRPQLPLFCGCDTCRGDVVVYALNRLAPHYVSTREGEVLTELSLGSDQEKAKLDVVLLEAFRKVALAPRCGARAVQLM
ncbi:MAG TPA: late competence development ComFB family protein [Gemmatimonadales bacterium]|nr:late competence development ComFB family protein [Gemmatimonadales bacterium]